MSIPQAIQLLETSIKDIQSLFTQPAQPEKLSHFMHRFSEKFEMIGVNGNQLNFHQLKAMFNANMGAYPDLKIEIKDISVIMHGANFVLLRYQEKQYTAEQCHCRIATAYMEFHVEHYLWRYLHETPILT
jgi:hypothetical protein